MSSERLGAVHHGPGRSRPDRPGPRRCAPPDGAAAARIPRPGAPSATCRPARKAFKEAEQALLHAISLAPKDAAVVGASRLALSPLRRLRARRRGACRNRSRSTATSARPRMMLANSLADLGKAKDAIAEYQRVLGATARPCPRPQQSRQSAGGTRASLKSAADHYARAAALSDALTYRISAAHTARRIADWGSAEPLEDSLLQSLRAKRAAARSRSAFLAARHAGARPPPISSPPRRQMAQSYADAPADYPHSRRRPWPPRPRLRIGYVSSDLHDHATTHLIVEALELHDRRPFRDRRLRLQRRRDKSGYRTRILKAFDRVMRDRRPVRCGGRPPDRRRRHRHRRRSQRLDDRRAAADPCASAGACDRALARPSRARSARRWIDYAIVDPIVAPPGSEAGVQRKAGAPAALLSAQRSAAGRSAPLRRARRPACPTTPSSFAASTRPSRSTGAIFELWMDLLRATPRCGAVAEGRQSLGDRRIQGARASRRHRSRAHRVRRRACRSPIIWRG